MRVRKLFALVNRKEIMASANTPSTQVDDPFFWLPVDHEWNACIGRQGDEESYVDGYIEAAMELDSAVIEKRMYEKRDTRWSCRSYTMQGMPWNSH